MEKRFKRNAAKWALIISACLLVAAFIVGVCLQTFGTGKAKPSEWFDSGKQEELTVGGGMVLPNNEKPTQGGNGISLYSAEIPVEAYAENGVSEDAENAYTVTATVSPDNDAQNTVVLWTLTWKDPSSAWATGKELTDYITATPNGEGVAESKTVTVVCLQAFGEPVILTAKCKYDETVTVSVQIDYAARLTLIRTELFSSQDTLGNTCNLIWGGNTVGTLDFGTGPQQICLLPSQIVYSVSDTFTLSDTYTATLKFKRNEAPLGVNGSQLKLYTGVGNPVGIQGFYVQDYSQALGSFEIANGTNSAEQKIFEISHENGEDSKFYLNDKGIGSLIVGGADGTYNFLDFSDNERYSEMRWNMYGTIDIFEDTPITPMPLCSMILEIKGLRETYSFTTNVIISEPIKTATLSGITLDESNLIF